MASPKQFLFYTAFFTSHFFSLATYVLSILVLHFGVVGFGLINRQAVTRLIKRATALQREIQHVTIAARKVI
jgi:hypothetical protein